MTAEPSVLPLSATITSAESPSFSAERCAFWMQRAMVSASFRQGMTIETSTAARVPASRRWSCRGASFISGESNGPEGGFPPYQNKRGGASGRVHPGRHEAGHLPGAARRAVWEEGSHGGGHPSSPVKKK